jgi:D-threo-aldose 1-dehydrogenase
MKPTQARTLGRSGVEVPQLGFGGAPLGELYARVSDTDADATLSAAWEAGVRYFDTAPWYGNGLSEHRVGDFLRTKAPSEYILSTKVGRLLRRPLDPSHFDPGMWAGGLPFERVFDYTYDGIMRSYEDSLQRLGLPRVDLLVIHDLDLRNHTAPERVTAYMAQLTTSGWRALDQLRRSGEIRAVGAGINELGLIPRFLDLFDLDFFLVAMCYTLLDQDLLEELPRCEASGVAVVASAVFNSGILATGAIRGAKYNYVEAPPDVVERVRRVEEVCQRHSVPLAAAAVHFPLGHPSVASVILGASTPEHVRRNVSLAKSMIPPDLWQDLRAERLIRPDAPIPTVAGGETV